VRLSIGGQNCCWRILICGSSLIFDGSTLLFRSNVIVWTNAQVALTVKVTKRIAIIGGSRIGVRVMILRAMEDIKDTIGLSILYGRISFVNSRRRFGGFYSKNDLFIYSINYCCDGCELRWMMGDG